MKYLTYLLLASVIATPFSALSAIPEALPPLYKKALKDAYESGNQFVIDAVMAQINEKEPNRKTEAQMYLATVASEKQEQEEQKKALKAQKDAPGWKGTVDVGGSVATGNAKETNLNANTKLTYKTGKFTNITGLTARSSSDDGETTNEEYFANNQTRYTLSPKSYSFLELEYVKDRFSGYEYRFSELLGYGYQWIDWDDFSFATEVSGGGRHSKSTDGEKVDSLLGKIGAETEWQITDSLRVSNDTSSSMASDAIITISDTALRNDLSDSLYLKLSHNLQHIDDVPAGTKKVDTLTTVGIGYEF